MSRTSPQEYVNIVHVVVNEHGAVFADLIELLADFIEQAGYRAERSTNEIRQGALNIIVGHTFVLKAANFAAIRNMGAPYIVFQMEALDEHQGFKRQQPAYFEFLLASRQIWDYSPTNVRYLVERGCQDVRQIPIGYSRHLERIVHADTKDIDILFYGSITGRRQRIMEQFKARGARAVTAFGAYGPERDSMIARARIVLNLHQFDLSHLEEVRTAYLLNNRCFVLSEASDHNPYGEGIVFAEYDRIVDCGMSYLAQGMEWERQRVIDAGYSAIRRIPTAEKMRSALEAAFRSRSASS